ncbi:hypothetical protein CKO51_07120 [Rhodopirellula sp. SM50]|nr:hypothetical protein CKO51_07120 [Rhodopirellula sp. SM50]
MDRRVADRVGGRDVDGHLLPVVGGANRKSAFLIHRRVGDRDPLPPDIGRVQHAERGDLMRIGQY